LLYDGDLKGEYRLPDNVWKFLIVDEPVFGVAVVVLGTVAFSNSRFT